MKARLLKLFKWRVRLVQQGYDLGWEHGYQAGMDEQHKQIIDLLNSNFHGVDWLKEEPITLKDIVPIVKEHQADKEPVGWH